MFSRSFRLVSTNLSQIAKSQFHPIKVTAIPARNIANQIRMAHQNTHFKLNTGAPIPAIGFGTWQDADAQADAVCEALKAGYRHIDSARM